MEQARQGRCTRAPMSSKFNIFILIVKILLQETIQVPWEDTKLFIFLPNKILQNHCDFSYSVRFIAGERQFFRAFVVRPAQLGQVMHHAQYRSQGRRQIENTENVSKKQQSTIRCGRGMTQYISWYRIYIRLYENLTLVLVHGLY